MSLDNTTYAYVDQDARVDAGGNVVVSAADHSDVDVIAGAIAFAVSGKVAGTIGAGVGIYDHQEGSAGVYRYGRDRQRRRQFIDMTVPSGG